MKKPAIIAAGCAAIAIGLGVAAFQAVADSGGNKVAALFEEHCRFGTRFQSEIYENMFNMTRPCMKFLIKQILNAVEDDFPHWSQAIATSYSHIPPGRLRVYLSPSPKIDILAVFHIIFQSLRLRHVYSAYLSSLIVSAKNHDSRHDGSIELAFHFHGFCFR